MDFIRIYTSYLKCFFKSRTEYRASFFMGVFSNFYCYLITFVSFYVIIDNFGTIDGWGFYDMCMLYGINIFTYAIAAMMFWNVFGIEKELLSGNLDTLLIRPMGVIKQLMCSKFTDTFIGQIIISGFFLAVSFRKSGVSILGIKTVYFVCILISGVMIHSAAMILFGAISFWTKKSLFFADFIYYDLRKFIEYPLSIFPIWIKCFFTFILPWGLINYYPALIILSKYKSKSDYFLGILSPFIGVIFLFFSLYVFMQGIKNYSSSGS